MSAASVHIVLRGCKVRVLISSGWLGGAGGAERALYSITRALSTDSVDVVVREKLDGPWAKTPAGTRVALANDHRWFGAGHTEGAKGRLLQRFANPVRRVIGSHYDVYLQFLSGANVGNAARTEVRLLVPSGNHVSKAVGQQFDAVAMQAPDNASLVPDGVRAVLLRPPVFDLAGAAEPPRVDVPDAYVLTVFNPYDPIKGMHELARAAEESPMPIVWCHSEATVAFEIPAALKSHRRIIHVCDATPSELRYLYEQCSAYVSFSLTEGFGWSTADALRYAPAVATRAIGLFSNEEAWQPGTWRIGPGGGVDWQSLFDGACDPSARNLTVLGAGGFRSALARVAAELHG